jgi:hypothetical protein
MVNIVENEQNQKYRHQERHNMHTNLFTNVKVNSQQILLNEMNS